jgi:hypothetical protein
VGGVTWPETAGMSSLVRSASLSPERAEPTSDELLDGIVFHASALDTTFSSLLIAAVICAIGFHGVSTPTISRQPVQQTGVDDVHPVIDALGHCEINSGYRASRIIRNHGAAMANARDERVRFSGTPTILVS